MVRAVVLLALLATASGLRQPAPAAELALSAQALKKQVTQSEAFQSKVADACKAAGEDQREACQDQAKQFA